MEIKEEPRSPLLKADLEDTVSGLDPQCLTEWSIMPNNSIELRLNGAVLQHCSICNSFVVLAADETCPNFLCRATVLNGEKVTSSKPMLQKISNTVNAAKSGPVKLSIELTQNARGNSKSIQGVVSEDLEQGEVVELLPIVKLEDENRKLRALITNTNLVMADNDRVIAEKGRVIQEKDRVIQEKDVVIEEKEAEIARLNALVLRGDLKYLNSGKEI